MGARLTHVGGPTVLIELGGWRLLTDPTFDPAGGSYRFGWGTGSKKLVGPALAPDQLGKIDTVLLSHDQHDDNLDAAGRKLLEAVDTSKPVVTTTAGAARLGVRGAVGLDSWQSTRLDKHGATPIEIVATPCRHGPPLSGPIVGDVTGFGVRFEGSDRFAVWVSGDTVLYDGVREVAERCEVDVALVHLGGVRFPISGPLRYTMNAAEAAELVSEIEPRVAVPIHYEGWSHFREPSPAGGKLSDPPFRWLEIGTPTDV